MRKFLSDSDGVTGVRVGIPFDAILHHSRHLHAATLPILTLTVSTGPIATDKPSSNISGSEVKEGVQSIQVAFHYMDAHWDELEELVKLGEERRRANSNPSKVIIDFGLGDESFDRDDLPHDDPEVLEARSKEQVICDWLAIDYTPEVWGTFKFILLWYVKLISCSDSRVAQHWTCMYGIPGRLSYVGRLLEQVAHPARREVPPTYFHHPSGYTLGHDASYYP